MESGLAIMGAGDWEYGLCRRSVLDTPYGFYMAILRTAAIAGEKWLLLSQTISPYTLKRVYLKSMQSVSDVRYVIYYVNAYSIRYLNKPLSSNPY